MQLIQLSSTSESDIISLLQLFQEAEDYFLLTKGKRPQKEDALKALTLTPQSEYKIEKFIYAVEFEGKFIGCVDYLVGYPSEHILFIGLVLLSPSYRGKGLGSKLFGHLKRKAITHRCSSIRISVVKNNVAAMKFWLSIGFNELYTKYIEGFTAEIVVLELEIYRPRINCA